MEKIPKRKRGRPPSSDRKTTVAGSVPLELADDIMVEARRRGISVAAFVGALIIDGLVLRPRHRADPTNALDAFLASIEGPSVRVRHATDAESDEIWDEVVEGLRRQGLNVRRVR